MATELAREFSYARVFDKSPFKRTYLVHWGCKFDANPLRRTTSLEANNKSNAARFFRGKYPYYKIFNIELRSQ